MRRNRIVFAVLWLLSLAGISFYGGAVSYGFFFCMTLIPAVCLLYLLAVYFCFHIYQEIGQRDVVCSQPVSYYFVLQNESFFAFAGLGVTLFSDLSYVEDIPDGMEFELLPGDRYPFHTRLVCRYRGEYEVGVKEIAVRDFLRLFSVRYRNPGTIKALVKPRIPVLSVLRTLPEALEYARRENRLAKDWPDVTARDYQPGDPLKRVHWGAAAREGKLKTREEYGEQKEGIVLFLDTKRYGTDRREFLPLENRMLEIVLALGMVFVRENLPFSFYWGQRQPRSMQVERMPDFDALYGQMCELAFDPLEDPEAMPEALAGSGRLNGSRIVVGVLHELGSAVLELADRLAREGTLVVLYLTGAGKQGRPVPQNEPLLRIVEIPTEADLEELL